MNKNIELYNKHFVQSNREMLDLFHLLKVEYNITSVVYPGSFVHISPALIFPVAAFIDNDRRVDKFFTDTEVRAMVEQRKEYKKECEIQSFQQDYDDETTLTDGSFDLMISLYAGFISQSCKKYLKKGGVLLVNNSHADAGLAFLDKDFALVAVVNRVGESWQISKESLNAYFIPKKQGVISKDELLATMKGIQYTKTASLYLFKKL